MKNDLTQEELKELLHYNPKTGKFTRIKAGKGVKVGGVGAVAGYVDKVGGYAHISVKGKEYLAHRLAFLYVEGFFPEHDVDHKNGVTGDNRWKNLRNASRMCNLQNRKIYSNNTSGFIGVGWNKQTKKWQADITINKKTIYLGQYTSKLEAALTRFTLEQQCSKWTCNARNVLQEQIQEAWPEFKYTG